VPEYQVEESGPDHQKSFRAVVRVGGQLLGSGAGRTKKAAEQQAAEAAWRAISAESGNGSGSGAGGGTGDGSDNPADGSDKPADGSDNGPAGA
jgi:ribonuclease III